MLAVGEDSPGGAAAAESEVGVTSSVVVTGVSTTVDACDTEVSIGVSLLKRTRETRRHKVVDIDSAAVSLSKLKNL